MDSGDYQDALDSQRKKRFHRHTPRQILELEAMFRECPHPDEKQRMLLGRELGLQPRQIKFWFQNRRTQMKAQNERADNSSLRAENERIRCENITMKEALRRVVCPNCGASSASEDAFDEDKLRLENARLKDELHRFSCISSKKLGAQIPVLSRVDRMVDLPPFFPSLGISDEQRPLLADLASDAMEELISLAQAGEPLWKKSEGGDRDILNTEAYNRIFTRARDPNLREEASRASCVARIAAEALVDILMDSSKWMELFPTIVSQARTIEVLSKGIGGRKGDLLLMHGEEQVLSPVVSPREFFFLRYCRQIDQSTWVIADVSRASPSPASPICRKLPSGCVIQNMFNGFSKVTWVEHVEVEDRFPVNRLFRDLIVKGVAFGAQRWAATLRRTCERSAFSMIHGGDSGTFSGDGKRSMMKLSQRMMSSFCASVFAGDGHRWTTTLSGPDDADVRVAIHRNVVPGQPNGVVLSATTSVWLPTPPESVFCFLRNKHTRPQWDVLSSGNSVQEVAHISTGQDDGNCISLLRGLNASESSMLILQENCTSAWGSMVVYAPIDISAMNVVMNGDDPSAVPLLPSGFAIVPGEGEGFCRNGALVTVAFQILVSSQPSARMNMESVGTVNNLISTTIRQIKAALN